jgi:hypothetical protein
MNASIRSLSNKWPILVSSIVFFSAGFAGEEAMALSRQEQRDQQLLKLSPETRLEQRCNARAMGLVSREHKSFRIDEFVAYAYGDPIVHGDSMQAPGGAIRNGKVWYHLSYNCQTTDNSLGIKSFSYQLGAPIPRDEWDKHYLVPK